MKHDVLSQAIADMRAESVDDETIRATARRVFRNVFDSALVPEPVERIRGCADFQSLIPAYLTGSLTAARVSLFEDHMSRCVECRHALRNTREPNRDIALRIMPETRRARRISLLPWAVAACLLAGISIGITAGVKGLLPGQHAVRATIMSVEGTLYRVSDMGSSLVAAGTIITNADDLRTAKGSRAILRLINGMRVEVGERSDISLTSGWTSSGVNLERGRMIVQTSDSRPVSFVVRAGDVVVPVRNAVFSVDRGTKGTRVAMARGSAQVQSQRKTVQLRAGQQFASDYRLAAVPISTEFAWSQNADYYLRLLSELTTLQKQLESIPPPGVRYQSALAQYLPDHTVMYAAIPNLGGTVAEAKRIFDERLAESDVLRQWWQQQAASRDNHLNQILTQISSISQYLGDEIVFGVPSDAAHQYGSPVILAQLRQSGLAEYLQQNSLTSNGIEIVSRSATPAPNAARPLYVCLDDGFAVASPDIQELRNVEQTISNPASGHFTQTAFFNRISHSYANGAGYVFAADVEQIIQKSVNKPGGVTSGLDNAQYLVLERRDSTAKPETRAVLSFAGDRQGVASWLGTPSPMGSLEFVSPDATFAAAVIMKNPRTVVNELISSLSQSDPRALQNLTSVQSQLGVNFADDIAAAFGGDATVAIDGPLVPVPAWKLIVEVYDPARLQQTLATLINDYNQRAADKSGKLTSGSEQVNSRTFYWVRSDKAPTAAAYYTFVDGYLLAGPSEGDLLQAIQNRQTGYMLVTSSRFQEQLPADNYTNFSAIIYHNAGSTLGPIVNQLRKAAPLTSTQQQSLSAILANTAPGLICLYGEPDRIVAATKSSFLGFNLGTLMGIAQGQPVVPLIASSAQTTMTAALRSQQQTRN